MHGHSLEGVVPGSALDAIRHEREAPRFDRQGNPMLLAGCPNCGSGKRWMTVVEWAARKNSGTGGTDEPCSRACALQFEHAERLAKGDA